MVKTFEIKIGGSTIQLETGQLANQAGGSVLARHEESVILATATASKEPREGIDFLPLIVDYEERIYAAGRIPGSFFRREGRPSEQAILLDRLTDRPLRPLFPSGFRNEVQVVITALSSDGEHHLDILSLIGASAALSISDIPFHGPIGAVRVGHIDGKFVFNPTVSQMAESKLDLRLAGTKDAVMMVEADAKEVSEDLLLEAIRQGHEAMQDVIRTQEEMAQELGKAKRPHEARKVDREIVDSVRELVEQPLASLMGRSSSKAEYSEALDAIRNKAMEALEESCSQADIKEAFGEVLKGVVRRSILEDGVRPDGREATTIRPISGQVGLLPRTHGSGLFTRGGTQVLAIATLGTVGEKQKLDGLGSQTTKRYIHHYNFPPYSTGETWFLRGPRRREIGHGALAEHALWPVLPPEEDFPYTVRVVSEVLSSNGSTSMASTCASTLALMDAGVPISSPVAGIAMGLIKEGDDTVVLTDIQGVEDHLGDMDFKVAGTAAGITALQMDIKVTGIGYDIMEGALAQANDARHHILDRMKEIIGAVRPELSPYAPRITILKVDPSKIGTIIGPGGKMIRSITEQFNVKIDVDDDGSVFVAATDGESSEQAIQMIRELTEDPEIGKIYTGTVKNITNFGAFVEILPGKEGLVHISQLADFRVPSVAEVVSPGDEVTVMVIGIDPAGKIRLSRQAVLEGWTPEHAVEMDRGSRSRGSREGGGRRKDSRPRRS